MHLKTLCKHVYFLTVGLLQQYSWQENLSQLLRLLRNYLSTPMTCLDLDMDYRYSCLSVDFYGTMCIFATVKIISKCWHQFEWEVGDNWLARVVLRAGLGRRHLGIFHHAARLKKHNSPLLEALVSDERPDVAWPLVLVIMPSNTVVVVPKHQYKWWNNQTMLIMPNDICML